MTDDALRRLAAWYERQCNGDWEHQYGVQIDTIDNPGWSFRVDLTGTKLVDRAFTPIEAERSDFDWVRCRVLEGKFEGFGGVRNLKELIEIFVAWAVSN